MSNHVEAKAQCQMSASCSAVYQAWLDEGSAREWMKRGLQSLGLSGEMVQVKIDAVEGGTFLLSDMREGVEAKHTGTYLKLVPDSTISFSWITDLTEEEEPSIATLELTPTDGNGCQATMTHQLDQKWAPFVSQTELGWTSFLKAIDELLSESS